MEMYHRSLCVTPVNDVPYQIKGQAVRDACAAVKAEKWKAKQTGQPFKMKFKSRKYHKQSCFIPKTAVKELGVYVRILPGVLLRSEALPSNLKDCRLVLDNGYYYLACPFEEDRHVAETQGRVVALDPGIRSFLTFYSEDSCGWIGKGDFGRIQRLCQWLDDLMGKISEARGKLVLDVNEAYTSKTCSWPGEVNRKFWHRKFCHCSHDFSVKISRAKMGGAKVVVGRDGRRMDRDINGARGIFLRALGDTPALQACVVE